MITIDVKSKVVSGWDRNQPMSTNKFGDATPGYVRGWIKPNFPVPVTESVNLFAIWCMDELESDWNIRYGEYAANEFDPFSS